MGCDKALLRFPSEAIMISDDNNDGRYDEESNLDWGEKPT